MINLTAHGIKAEFGNGDIHMFTSINEDEYIGYVYLENCDPNEIGQFSDEETLKQYHKEIIDEQVIPCVMSFTKTESIDALIAQLITTKEYMLKNLHELLHRKENI